jgi:hypothetical protein
LGDEFAKFGDVRGEFVEFAVEGEGDGEVFGEEFEGVDEDVCAFVFDEGADEGDAEVGLGAFVSVALDVVDFDAVGEVGGAGFFEAVGEKHLFHGVGGDEDAVDLVDLGFHVGGSVGGGLDVGGVPAFGGEVVLDGPGGEGEKPLGGAVDFLDDVFGLGDEGDVADAVGGDAVGALAEGAIGEAKLDEGADEPEIGRGEDGGDVEFAAGVNGGGGEAEEVDEVDDVGLEVFEVGFEMALKEIVAVFHFDDVGLVTHGDVGVEEALDAEVFVGVGVEAFFFGEGFLGGVAGKDVDVVAAGLEFLGDAQGDDFGAGDVVGEELVDGEEDTHS